MVGKTYYSDSLLKRKYVNKKNVRGFSKINLGGR